ncbi:carboxypeptidase C (cathepsin A) [Rheinheimera sp. A13L]|uniref:S10 family peptidase n=1 Tax=Rheinheimera sp. A13L TaxID=506534 RepID=UPI00021249E8|nr:carboxypeptidase [Rheinheimera sp. A13L]EGM78973.1 carboxypeptidase C (cathepsin A) [Rheinheimera sp. A13L]
MKISPLLVLGLCLSTISLSSAVQADEAKTAKNASIQIDADSVVVTDHKTTVLDQSFNYKAYTGTQPVWNEQGEPTAAIFYTYYERQNVKDRKSRPLLISFNGGPGSASVWMQIAYSGPKALNVDSEGYPLQPYGVKQNPYSVLDTADIVFVNPVNTAYSRVLPGKDGKMPSRDEQQKMFFGVNADIKYLAEWVNTFVSRYNRWESPKYLIGESYGTTRVSGLALALQNQQWMYLNGVVLVSPTDIGIKRDGPVDVANRLPYFAATAWYHKALNSEFQQKDLLDFLPEVEAFTLDTYLPALAKGNSLPEAEKQKVAEQVARYSGLSVKAVLQNNLDIDNNFFWKELLRERGQTVGRLDSRYLGIDKKEAGSAPDYNAELTSWLHSFTPAINHYLKNELKYKTDIKYNMFGNVHPWDRSNDNTGENLRQAMAQNPYLHVMTQSGYYDGATNYFDAKYNMWQLDPSGKMKDRLSFKGYRSGHMMYLRYDDLRQSNQDLRDFIKATLPKPDQAAKY